MGQTQSRSGARALMALLYLQGLQVLILVVISFTRYTQAARNFLEVNFFLRVGAGILSRPKIAAQVSFQKLGVLALKARHLGAASSMSRTILVQVFNCLRPIFRSIKPQFSKLCNRSQQLCRCGRAGRGSAGKPQATWVEPSWSLAKIQGAAEALGCTLVRILVRVF